MTLSRKLRPFIAATFTVLAACGSSTAKQPDAAACLTGSTQCGATCVELASDQLNCGACGNVCGAGDRCTTGTCTPIPFACPTGLTTCGGTCRDVAVDHDHCGACGTSCTAAEFCEAGTCEPRGWEPLAPLTDSPNFSDFAPAGQTALYTANSSTLQSFTFPVTATPMGVFATLAAPPQSIGIYSSNAFVGTNLHILDGTSVFSYAIGTNTWTTPVNATLTHALSQSQSTGDDSGFVYSRATDFTVVQFKIADGSVAYITGPADLTTSEPRAAWDSDSKRVYLGDYNDSTGTLYALDPTTGTLTKLTSFPDAAGLSDAFCSDRKGHLYTANSGNGISTTPWMYTVATDTWAKLPSLNYVYGSSEACTVSADGWLYFGDGDANKLQRLKL